MKSIWDSETDVVGAQLSVYFFCIHVHVVCLAVVIRMILIFWHKVVNGAPPFQYGIHGSVLIDCS